MKLFEDFFWIYVFILFFMTMCVYIHIHWPILFEEVSSPLRVRWLLSPNSPFPTKMRRHDCRRFGVPHLHTVFWGLNLVFMEVARKGLEESINKQTLGSYCHKQLAIAEISHKLLMVFHAAHCCTPPCVGVLIILFGPMIKLHGVVSHASVQSSLQDSQ